MGSGFRTFTAGEVLTASNVQNYLMDQSVMVFGGSAARSSAIGTANFEEGMVSYLTDTDKVEAYNGTDWVSVAPTTSQGLTLINTTSFSAVSSVSAPTGTFSALYRNYKVILDFTTASPTPNIQLRFRVGGVDNSTASSYNMQPLYGSGSSVVTANEVGAQAIIGNASSSTSLSTITMEIFAPFIANTTNFVSFPMQSGGNLAMIRTGFHNQSTSYDSISIIPTSSTITGQMYIYGYNI